MKSAEIIGLGNSQEMLMYSHRKNFVVYDSKKQQINSFVDKISKPDMQYSIQQI